MDSYTITIAPNDDSGSTTRLVVDSSGGQVRITDVHLHAADGLSSGHIPSVDFGLLLLAVTGGGHSPDTAGSAPAAVAAVGATGPAVGEIESSAPNAEEPDATPAPVSAAARRRRAAKAAPPRASSAPAGRSGRGRTATPPDSAAPTLAPSTGATSAKRAAPRQAPAATAPVRKAPARKVPAKKATPVKAAAAAKGASGQPAAESSGRVYRRAPDDLAAVFERMGTVAAVADHYQVPRYTAQGWIGRLRAAQ
jgi:hypothetical protein